MVSIRRSVRGRFRLDRSKFWLMGVVAVSAEIVSPFTRAHKVSRSFSMNACSPVSENWSMTFATESIALCEVYEITIKKPQFISVFWIMTVEAPPHCLGMMKLDLCMFFFQFPLFSIYLHGGMAVATGKHSLRHWGWRNRKLFVGTVHQGFKTNP